MSEGNRQNSSSPSSPGKRKSSGSPARRPTSVGAAKKPKRRRRANKTHYVEKILKKRYVNGRPQLLLKWQGYSMEESTWEPIENLTGDCMRMLADFEAELFAEQCKRARSKTDASMVFTALNDSSPSSSSLYVEENSPSAASFSATPSPASINVRHQLIQMPSPMINLVDVKQEEESVQPQLAEQRQGQQLLKRQSRERISQGRQMQEQQPQEEQLQAQIQQKEMPQKEMPQITPQKQQLQEQEPQEQQPPELQLRLPTPKTSPKLSEELNLSSDSSSASDSDSSSSSSGSGSSSNSSNNSKSSKKGNQIKRTPVQHAIPKSNPFFINLDFSHKLNLSSEDDTDDEVALPATGPTSAMERREVNANRGNAKSSIETLKEQARKWHESRGKASEKSENQMSTEKPEKQPTARPEAQPTPTQPIQPKLLAIPNKIKEQWLKRATISPETPKSRRRMTMHVDSVEVAMEQIHRSGSLMNRRMSLDRGRSRSNSRPTSNGRFKNVNTLTRLENSPKRCESADKSRIRAEIAQQNLSISSPIIRETLATAAEPLYSMPTKPLSPKPSPLPSTPKTPEPSSVSSVGGSSGSSASTTRPGSTTSHISQVGNWDDSLQLPARPQGIERGLALEKILKSFKMRGETYLVVKWKAVSVPDAVLLSGVIELYPHIVIEYFEKLQLRSPLD